MPLSGIPRPDSSASTEMVGASMITIAQNPFYHFMVDVERNRILIKIKGCWNSPEEVPFYLIHLKEAISLVQPGFSILTDLRHLEEYAPSVRLMHIEAQKLTVASGIWQVAEVHDFKNAVNQLAVAMAQESGIPLNIFDSLQDAEDWLSELHTK